MNYIVCMPFIHRPYAEDCLKTCKFPEENLFLVDNTEYNNGIMRSHNLGIKRMREVNADWLVIMSAAIRFGRRAGGLDFIDKLEDNPKNLVIEAAGVNGWHLIAFSREVIEKVGKWDQNFSPYGFDDLDYSWRIQLAFDFTLGEQLWRKFNIDVEDKGMAHSLHLTDKIDQSEAKVHEKIYYYRSKWGIHPGEDHANAYRHPFGEPSNSVAYWPPSLMEGAWND